MERVETNVKGKQGAVMQIKENKRKGLIDVKKKNVGWREKKKERK